MALSSGFQQAIASGDAPGFFRLLGTSGPEEVLQLLREGLPCECPESISRAVERELETLPEARLAELRDSGGGWAQFAQELLSDTPRAHRLPGVDAVLDSLLGLRILEVEEKWVPSGRGLERGASVDSALGEASWSGSGVLSRSSLNTPYLELFEVLDRVSPAPGSHFVDLGAGFGRLGFVIGLCLEGVRFTGYEIVAPRVEESRRAASLLELPVEIRFEVQDLAAPGWAPVEADYYFLYDPVNRDTLVKVLADLRKVSAARTIRLISRGRTGGLQEMLRKTLWLRTEAMIPTAHQPIFVHRSA
jgi:hypothetical protein